MQIWSQVPCNSTMRRSVQPDQVLSPDVSSITSGLGDTGLRNDLQNATKDQTPDMFEENYTKLLMRKQHFKFCWTTQDSTGFSLGNSHDFSGGDQSSRDKTCQGIISTISLFPSHLRPVDQTILRKTNCDQGPNHWLVC